MIAYIDYVTAASPIDAIDVPRRRVVVTEIDGEVFVTGMSMNWVEVHMLIGMLRSFGAWMLHHAERAKSDAERSERAEMKKLLENFVSYRNRYWNEMTHNSGHHVTGEIAFAMFVILEKVFWAQQHQPELRNLIHDFYEYNKAPCRESFVSLFEDQVRTGEPHSVSVKIYGSPEALTDELMPTEERMLELLKAASRFFVTCSEPGFFVR